MTDTVETVAAPVPPVETVANDPTTVAPGTEPAHVETAVAPTLEEIAMRDMGEGLARLELALRAEGLSLVSVLSQLVRDKTGIQIN